MSDRGVSEVLGFVLVFALVTGTIGVVFATGISGLENAQYEEKMRNVERAFDVLDDNLQSLHAGSAPSRATEVKLYDGRIELGESTELTIVATNTGNTSDNVTIPTVTRPILYVDDEQDTEMAYSVGAVFRTDRGRSVMLSEPDWVVTDDTMLVPFIATAAGDGTTSIGGRGTVLVVGQKQSQSVKGEFVPGDGVEAEVNVTVESPRAAAWKAYLETLPHDGNPPDADASDGTVSYVFVVEHLYVPETIIDVSLSR